MKDVRAAPQKLEAPQFQFAEVLRTSEPAKHNLLLAANAKKAHEGWWDTFFSLMGNFNQGIGSNSRNDLKLDFQDLKDRMMKAEDKMDEIDSKRRPPKTSNTFETARLSSEVVV